MEEVLFLWTAGSENPTLFKYQALYLDPSLNLDLLIKFGHRYESFNREWVR